MKVTKKKYKMQFSFLQRHLATSLSYSSPSTHENVLVKVLVETVV